MGRQRKRGANVPKNKEHQHKADAPRPTGDYTLHGRRVSSDRRDHRHPAANLDGHAGVVVMDGKKCAKCGEVKPLSEFNLHRKNKDGFDYKCRECAAELQREWRKRNRAV